MKLLYMLRVPLRGRATVHAHIKPRSGLYAWPWHSMRTGIPHIGPGDYIRPTVPQGRWRTALQHYYKCAASRENEIQNNLQLARNFMDYSPLENDLENKTSIHLLIEAGYRHSEILHDVNISELSLEQIQHYLKIIHKIGRNVYPSPKLIMFIHDSYGKRKLSKEELLEIEEADTELKITLVEGVLHCSREDVEKMKYAPVRKKSSIPHFLKKVDFLLANSISINQIRTCDELFATSLEKLQNRLQLIKSAQHEFGSEECLKILTMSNSNLRLKLNSLEKTNHRLHLKYGPNLHKYKILAKHLDVRYCETFVEKILLLEKMNFSDEDIEDMDRRLLTVDKSLLPLVIEPIRSEGIMGNVISTVYSHRILKLVQEFRKNRIYSNGIAKLLKIDRKKLKEMGVHSLSPKSHVTENVAFLQSVGFSSDDVLKCISLLRVCPHRLKSRYEDIVIKGDMTVTDSQTQNFKILNILLHNIERDKNSLTQQSENDDNDTAADRVLYDEHNIEEDGKLFTELGGSEEKLADSTTKDRITSYNMYNWEYDNSVLPLSTSFSNKSF